MKPGVDFCPSYILVQEINTRYLMSAIVKLPGCLVVYVMLTSTFVSQFCL